MDGVQIRNVLAAVDFSEWTDSVLAAAIELAGDYDAALVAMYAEMFLPPPYFTERGIEGVSQFLDVQREAARDHLQITVEAAVKSRVRVESRLVESSPAEGILRTAEQTDAGLVVMGTHGRSAQSPAAGLSSREGVARDACSRPDGPRAGRSAYPLPAPVRADRVPDQLHGSLR